MTGVGARFDSLRLSSPEMRRLGLALALSLAMHLFAWGGYEADKKFGWWQRLHWPTWLPRLAIMKIVPAPVPQNNEPQLTFVEVAQPAAEAPQNTKYYSSQNSRAADPTKGNKDVPQLNGKQIEVVKTENAPRPDFNKLQPSPPAPPQQKSQPATRPGDLTLGKPENSRPAGAGASAHHQTGARAAIAPTTQQANEARMRDPPFIFLEEERLKWSVMQLDRAFKNKLGAWQQANSSLRLSHGGKASRERIAKTRRCQLVSDFGRARGHAVKTIIAHLVESFLRRHKRATPLKRARCHAAGTRIVPDTAPGGRAPGGAERGPSTRTPSPPTRRAAPRARPRPHPPTSRSAETLAVSPARR